ncbi:MAG TPA: winged helix DNA-binding domain-containing protein [Candidatus Limnocylindrales bacterium]|nr:winged helix DNA-binding domain-containing protein [Candidatus Limnocylindrales bacterium]
MRHLLAVQAQDYPGATWAVGRRTRATTAARIDAAFDRGEIVRTHVLRPTWHIVAPDDLRWLQALAGPRVQTGNGSRYRQLGIDAEVALAARKAFERTLAGGGTATRDELREALVRAGIEVDVARLTHLVMHAELEAVLCSGPRRGSRQTYMLVEERIPPSRPRDRDEALAELARRYVEGHGPAQVVDLVWWSGLTTADARRGLEAAGDALRRETVGERTFWSAGTELAGQDGPTLRLLPNYDELLVAFRDRTDAIDPDLPEPARVPEAILAHVVVRDGLVAGAWRRREGLRSTGVAIDLRVAMSAGERRLLAAEVDRFAAFLGRRVEVAGLD